MLGFGLFGICLGFVEVIIVIVGLYVIFYIKLCNISKIEIYIIEKGFDYIVNFKKNCIILLMYI